MHYYRFFINDYRSSTSHLTNEEDLAYRRLIDMYYDTETPIPAETEWVSRRLRLGSQVVLSVLADFFVLEPDGWHHPVCDEVIQDYRAQKSANQVNGRKGGRPKRNPTETQSVSFANRNETEVEAKKSLITNQESLREDIVPSVLVGETPPKAPKVDQVPYEAIITAYNSICVPAGRPAARRNNEKRKARIRAIWRESPKAQTVDWWQSYFAKAMQVPHIAKGFITRDGSHWNGADLDYLLQDRVLTKIVEGTYAG